MIVIQEKNVNFLLRTKETTFAKVFKAESYLQKYQYTTEISLFPLHY